MTCKFGISKHSCGLMTMPGLKIWLMTAISYIMPVAGSVNQLLFCHVIISLAKG